MGSTESIQAVNDLMKKPIVVEDDEVEANIPPYAPSMGVAKLGQEFKAMQRILIKRPMLNGDQRLVKGQVLSQTGDTVRVMLEGGLKPVEVKASEMIPASFIFGTNRPDRFETVIPKQYPTSPNALANLKGDK
jgi:hypothetical protein